MLSTDASTAVSTANDASTSKTIAVAQLCSTSHKVHNLVQMAQCAGWAKRAHATMLFLPEACGFLGHGTVANAEPADCLLGSENGVPHQTNPEWLTERLKDTIDQAAEQGSDDVLPTNDKEEDSAAAANQTISIVHGLQTIAQSSGMWVSAGGVHILADDTLENDVRRVYNTHLIFNDQGQCVARYQKIHLFDVNLPGRVQLQESQTTAPGHKVVVCDSPVGRLGVTVCYDVRFPELYVTLVKQGAEVLLVPSAFTVPTGQAHWHVLLRARAIESQCYVVAAAQCGTHNEKRASYGHSLVVDPWGSLLADAGGDNHPCIVTAPIDLPQLHSIRQRMPTQQHRETARYD